MRARLQQHGELFYGAVGDAQSRRHERFRNLGVSRHFGGLRASFDGLFNFCLPLLVGGLSTFNFALMCSTQFANEVLPVTFDPRQCTLRDVETGRFASAAVTDNGRPHGERFGPRSGSPYTARYSNQARSNAKKRHNNMIDGGAGTVSGIRRPLLPTW